jgi:DNA anti-recombination protein RmuC
MHDKLPPTDDEYLKALSLMICAQYESINEKLDKQNEDLRERLNDVKKQIEKSDLQFEAKLEKLDDKVEKMKEDHHNHVISFVDVKAQTRTLSGAISAGIAIVTSIIISVVGKLLGF